MENLPNVEIEEAMVIESIPPWTSHITIRGVFASIIIGIIYSVIEMKLNLTTGFAPNFNVSAAFVAFAFIRTWTMLLHKAGFVSTPFTKQENTVIQTCAVACYSIAFGGGFGSYVLGLNKKTYEQAGINTEGNPPGSYKEPALGWLIGFLFVSNFVGLLALVPLRKVLVIDYKLAYPSGTATAVLINGFHTPKKDKKANGFIQVEKVVDLQTSLHLGYKPGNNRAFNFDFSLTYIGAGMICSHTVNLSLLFGAVISWGLMWPLIGEQKGVWFPKTLPESSMKSLDGYKVFISIALILGDGVYNFSKTLYFTASSIYANLNKKTNRISSVDNMDALDDLRENELFLKDRIPLWLACTGYVLFSVISIIIIPLIFPQLKWYYVVVTYILAPFLSFCNAYGAGLTDQNMAYNYGKVALFIVAASSGKDNGVIAALVACGLVKSMLSMASNLMQDLKAGHLTLTSPRSMLLSQAIGTTIGCVVAPVTFMIFYRAFDIGNPDGEYKAPYAIIYRNLAILGVEGFSSLPHHCLQLAYGFFAFAIAANLVRDISPQKVGKWMPLPMVIAVPFLVGANFAIDMCIGSLIVYVWHRVNKKKASFMVSAVASGLICGDGLWILPASILALAKVNPPICMNFLAAKSQ
ncbi:hypothetical protein AgCh_036901 [Apium graveolens]